MSDLIKQLSWNRKLEVLRTIKGWTQKEAAEKCNTDQKAYWNWESGSRYPRKNNRIAIAIAFGITEEEIFSEKKLDKGGILVE
jgi:transcriptional regulator with XRE-family HTH domain